MGNEQLTGQQPGQLSFTQSGNLSDNQTTESRTSIDSPTVVASSGAVVGSNPPRTEGLSPQGTRSISGVTASPYAMAQTQAQGSVGSFNMAEMNRALPDYSLLPPGQPYAQPHQQRFPSGPADSPGPALVYQLGQIPHVAGQGAVPYANNPIWSMAYPQHYPNVYPQTTHTAVGAGYPQYVQPQQVHSSGVNTAQNQYPNAAWMAQQQHQQANAYYYSPYTGPGHPNVSGQTMSAQPAAPYPVSYPRRPSLPLRQSPTSRQEGEMEGNYPQAASGGVSGYRASHVSNRAGGIPDAGSGVNTGSNVVGSPAGSSLYPSMPRGPPRKPKQSGHALWVGNLPPGTNVVDLKDHFSRDATADIESVFLISKSNCAFVNYKTEAACASAMGRFHDSRFQGVRLVCRLRRGSVSPSSSTPTGPASSMPSASSEHGSQAPAAQSGDSQDTEKDGVAVDGVPKDDAGQPRDRFFIVKSLTVEDLDLSVQNGVWATQSHNEEALNRAFESGENVYLIFSANKSGEYYGYARMASPINEDSSSLTTEWMPKMQVIESADLPKAIPTPATEHAPKGKIIDDSARGTIFWEADTDSDDPSGAKDNPDDSSERSGSQDGEDGAAFSKSWGKPFKIEWISTTRLPFYRTRGLRNPWNANREVKIARDGTELETSVGRRLIQMFHRSAPSPAAPSMTTVPVLQVPLGGYPQMRQY